MENKPARFPKVKAPFTRSDNERGNYTVNPEVQDGYSWVFDRAEEVEAVEKLNGTNVAVYVEDGEITDAMRREGGREMVPVDPYAYSDRHIVRGIQNSSHRFSYMEKDFDGDGWHFGELVGPNVQGNPYELEEHLFVPFEWLRRKATYRSYGEYSVEFDAISDWFEDGLFSLFYMLMHGLDSVEAASVSNGVFVEGIVFIHPDHEGRIGPNDMETVESEKYGEVTESLAKIRREMFDWHKSK